MIFEYDNIVIGSTLSALAFAYINDYPVFFTNPDVPFRFDYLMPNYTAVSMVGESKVLNSFSNQIEVGTSKRLLWDRLLFLLSLNGKVPLSNLCYKIRYDGVSMVCSNEYSKIFEASFNNCHYFGDRHAAGFVKQKSLDEDSYICYDYIAVNSGGKHEIDLIDTNDNFVSEIWFYGADRIDGNTPVRDACAVSKLTESQLRDFDYSETMARFKVLKIMKDNGMRGKLRGSTKNGTPRHYDFRTTSIRRETHRIRAGLGTKSSSVQIKTDSEASLLRILQDADCASDRFLEALNVPAS